MKYDIELGQGDSDEVGVILKENNIGSDLTGAIVKFHMMNNRGIEYEIDCESGIKDPFTKEIITPKSEGGVTILFTSVHTEISGTFYGKFIVILLGKQVSFPSGNQYIKVRIWEAV